MLWGHTFEKGPIGVSQLAQLLRSLPKEMGKGFWRERKKECDQKQYIHSLNTYVFVDRLKKKLKMWQPIKTDV